MARSIPTACLAAALLLASRPLEASSVSVSRSSFTTEARASVSFHWRVFRELLAESVRKAQPPPKGRERRTPPIPSGPIVETAFEHWLSAFEAAPYFSPLVDDLGRRQLVTDLVAYCRKNREGPRRRACLLALSACQPDPLRRLAPLREYQQEYRTFGLFHVWYAGTLIDLHLKGHSSTDGCYESALTQLVKAFELDPLEESLYARMLQELPTVGPLLSYFGRRVPEPLALAATGFANLTMADRLDVRLGPDRRAELLGRSRHFFGQLSGRYPKQGLGSYLLGAEAFRRQSYGEAIGHLERARKAMGDHHQVLFLLGRTLMEANQVPAAIEVFRALGQVRVEPGAWHNIAVCLSQGGKADEARAAYLRTLALDPFYGPSLLNLAALEIQSHREDAARPFLETLISREPTHAQGLFWLGVLAIRHEEIARAQEYLQTSLAIRPDASWTRLNLSSLLTRREEFHRAAEVLEPILALPGAPIDQVRARLVAIAWARIRKAAEWERAGRPIESRNELKSVLESLGPRHRPPPPLTVDDIVPLRRVVERKLR